jgi:hypothetical protein
MGASLKIKFTLAFVNLKTDLNFVPHLERFTEDMKVKFFATYIDSPSHYLKKDSYFLLETAHYNCASTPCMFIKSDNGINWLPYIIKK